MKKLKKLTTLIMLILAVVLSIPNFPIVSNGIVKVSAATIKLNKKKATLVKGQKFNLRISGTVKKLHGNRPIKKLRLFRLKGW